MADHLHHRLVDQGREDLDHVERIIHVVHELEVRSRAHRLDSGEIEAAGKPRQAGEHRLLMWTQVLERPGDSVSKRAVAGVG